MKKKSENQGNNKKIKNGIIFGKFYPLHIGHVDFIQRAGSTVDNLYVTVCTDEERDVKLFKESKMKKMPTPEDRIKFLEQTFKYQNNIKIIHLDEKGIPSYPNGWKGWSDRVRELLSKNNIRVDTVFTNETQDVENYRENFVNLNDTEEIFNRELKIVTTDIMRANFRISATEIRKNLYNNWIFIPRYVREFFTLKVAVIGSENSGKTNLTHKLANYFNTSFVQEYRKKYIKDVLKNNFANLKYEDYSQIAREQNRKITNSVKNANKITIIDTEYISLQAYSLINTGKENEIIKDFIKKSGFDIVIYVDKNNSSRFDSELKKLLEKYNIKYFILPFYEKKGNFMEIYNKSIEIINDFIEK
ncbi:MAG: multifunctional transcriptional regulator/nicotinamide-nucleotide adenylyltransferase/ribosylnicotinamide kinase NadR [Leptotrichiaceae bacterium]|nr:multifunctional transcriptional regulator/nicotinamide-nucleotide adenylyltransferase/ribosylnicotinamide kinase NadR [Leptotrichiaceae bacterium]